MTKITTPAGLRPAPFPPGSLAAAWHRIRDAVLRYLRWRAASLLQGLDPRTLHEFGIHPKTLLSVVNALCVSPQGIRTQES